MNKKNASTKRRRRSICEEIQHTEQGPPYETIVVSVSITRGLYLHALRGVESGDYASLSNYVSDLIRRDKHWKVADRPVLLRSSVK